MAPARVAELLGEDAKGYFEASIGEDGNPVFGRRVDDQPW
jgi:hypothetical protein